MSFEFWQNSCGTSWGWVNEDRISIFVSRLHICSLSNLSHNSSVNLNGAGCPLTLFFSSSRKVCASTQSRLALVSEWTAETWSNSTLTGFHCFSLKPIFSRTCSRSFSSFLTACSLEQNGHKQHHKTVRPPRPTPRCTAACSQKNACTAFSTFHNWKWKCSKYSMWHPTDYTRSKIHYCNSYDTTQTLVQNALH